MTHGKTALIMAFLVLASGAGCARNVSEFEFTKWGYSYVPRTTGIDTSAQGGGAQNNRVPASAGKTMPKASIGGTYKRKVSTSSNYRMTGGFHVTPSSN